MFIEILKVSLSTILVMAIIQIITYLMTTRLINRPVEYVSYQQPRYQQPPPIVYQQPPPPQQQQQPLFPPSQNTYQPVLTQPTVNTQETSNLSYEDLLRQATPTSARMDSQLPNGIQETFTRQQQQ